MTLPPTPIWRRQLKSAQVLLNKKVLAPFPTNLPSLNWNYALKNLIIQPYTEGLHAVCRSVTVLHPHPRPSLLEKVELRTEEEVGMLVAELQVKTEESTT